MSGEREQAREAARRRNSGMRDMLDLTPRAADAASEVWEVKVQRLQRLVRIANGAMEPHFAPITALQVLHNDPGLMAEALEALEALEG